MGGGIGSRNILRFVETHERFSKINFGEVIEHEESSRIEAESRR